MRRAHPLLWLIPLGLAAPTGCAASDSDPDADPLADTGAADDDDDDDDASDESDGGMESSGGETPVNPETCDLFAQDCVDQAAPKCAPLLDGPAPAEDYEAVCTESFGDAGLDEACEVLGGPGEDTCAPGLFCAPWGTSSGDPMTCRPLCSLSNPCEDDERFCGQISGVLGACNEPCLLFGDGCPTDSTCKLQFSVNGEAGGVCSPDGDGERGSECQVDEDCGADLECLPTLAGERRCVQLCDDGHGCPTDEGCYGLEALPEIGACLAADWSCVGEVEWPDAEAASVEVEIHALAALTFVDVPDATVSACAADDVECEDPLDTATTNAEGRTTMTVPTEDGPFDGYFQLTAPGYLASLGYPRHPIAEGGVVQVVIIHSLVAERSGLHPDPSRGAVATLISDCVGTGAPGVRLSSDTQDEESINAYVNDEGLPDTGLEASTANGQAILAQLPPGSTVLNLDAAVGTVAERSVHVRADALTYVHLSPTP